MASNESEHLELVSKKAVDADAITQHGYIAGNTFAVQWVEYQVVGRRAVFEGDIVLGDVEELEATRRAIEAPDPTSAKSVELRPQADEPLRQAIAISEQGAVAHGVAITGPQFRWPHRTIAFEIDRALPKPDRVRDAIRHWERETSLRFIERTGKNKQRYLDYISFEDHEGCWSQVGRRGGKQVISLGPGCSVGNAIHEIGHAAGLWHEQGRSDRDLYITIIWVNILPTYHHNFQQHVTDGTDIGEYNFDSMMHYPATAFSRNGLPTIATKNGEPIGQRNGLSKGDIDAISQMYA